MWGRENPPATPLAGGVCEAESTAAAAPAQSQLEGPVEGLSNSERVCSRQGRGWAGKTAAPLSSEIITKISGKCGQ